MAEALTLNQRAVVTKPFRWLPGVLSANGYRILSENEIPATIPDASDTNLVGDFPSASHNSKLYYGVDLNDAATCGVIEHSMLAPLGIWLERNLSHGGIRQYRVRRGSVCCGVLLGPWGCDLPEALVAALESAP